MSAVPDSEPSPQARDASADPSAEPRGEEGTAARAAAKQAGKQAGKQVPKQDGKQAGKQAQKEARQQRRTAKLAEREAQLIGGPPRPRWNDLKQFGLILRAAHPKLAVATGLLVGAGAASSGRPALEAVVAGAAVLVALLITGLLNDIFDRALDKRSEAPGKPIAEGRVPVGNAVFVATALFVLLVPMALQSGTIAGLCILGLLGVALLHNRTLRRTPFSLLPWAASGVLLVCFLAYGGWGLGRHGSAPAPGMVMVGAMAGICAHLATSLTHLPFDHKAGIKPFPLAVALRAGAPKVLLLTATLSAGTVMAFIIGALSTGLHS